MLGNANQHAKQFFEKVHMYMGYHQHCTTALQLIAAVVNKQVCVHLHEIMETQAFDTLLALIEVALSEYCYLIYIIGK